MYYVGRFQLTPQFRLQKSYQINFDKSCIQTAFLVAALLSHTLASRGVAKETMRFENDDGATMKVNMVNDVAGHMEKLLVPVVPSKRVSKTHQNPMNKNSMYILYIYTLGIQYLLFSGYRKKRGVFKNTRFLVWAYK